MKEWVPAEFFEQVQVVGSKEEQKIAKKHNKTVKHLENVFKDMNRYYKQNMETAKNSTYPERTSSVKNTSTNFEALWISIYSDEQRKNIQRGQLIYDGRENLYININAATGYLFFYCGPKLEELTECKYILIDNRNSYSATNDRGEDLSEHFKAGEKPTDWKKKYLEFVNYINGVRAANFTILDQKDKEKRIE